MKINLLNVYQSHMPDKIKDKPWNNALNYITYFEILIFL